jgi:hypothetical protein
MKMKVISDGVVTRVEDETGRMLDGVTAVRFRHEAPGRLAIVEIDMIAHEVGFPGEGKVYIGGREVRRIIFADGGEEEF